MSHHCLLSHHWVGCRCERCGKLRDQDHPWTGCRCPQCGLVRNQGHDWELEGCRLHCRRCGCRGAEAHAWNGCVCQRCGVTKHCWIRGECVHCGERCRHLLTAVQSRDNYSTAVTAYGELSGGHVVCQDCGLIIASK